MSISKDVHPFDMGEQETLEVPGFTEERITADEAAEWCEHLVRNIGSHQIGGEWSDHVTDEISSIIEHVYPHMTEFLDYMLVEALALQWAILGGLVGPKIIRINVSRVIETIDELLPRISRIIDPQNPGEIGELVLADAQQPEVIKVLLKWMQEQMSMRVDEFQPEDLAPLYGVTLVTLRAVEPELCRCLRAQGSRN